MDPPMGFNKLFYYLDPLGPKASVILGGSATPGLTLKEIVTLSNDSEATRSAFDLDSVSFGLGSAQGDDKLRQVIAETYENKAVAPSDIIVANGTSGSNHIVHRSLLKPDDHVICQYPVYSPCIEEPLDIGCDVSYLRLNPEDNWSLNIEQLKELIRPGKTRLIMLNNPGNPTGTYIPTQTQREIISLAKQHDITVHSDEIFRPLFYSAGRTPTSMVEHPDLDYDKVIATSSLSKVYGLSGIRIGWITTRSAELRQAFMSYRVMSVMSVSKLDEAIAVEVLGPRCRLAILKKHVDMAKTNIDLIQQFIDEHGDQCEWVKPTSGAVGFVKFKDSKKGEAVDDVEFCKRLFDGKKLVLSPATMCFEFGDPEHSLKGRCRMHFTVPTETLRKGLQLLGEFLNDEKSK